MRVQKTLIRVQLITCFFKAFNLINDIDVPATEARIAKFRAENAAIIEANVQKEESYAASLREQEEYDRQRRAERARELARAEEEERLAREAERRELIDKLESSDKDARKLVAKTKAEAAKRHARTASAASPTDPSAARIRIVKSAVADVPHVPLQDDWYAYTDKYELRTDGYHDPLSEAVRKDREGIMRGGGYFVEEAWERAIRSAVAGLDLSPLSDKDAHIHRLGDNDMVMGSV